MKRQRSPTSSLNGSFHAYDATPYCSDRGPIPLLTSPLKGEEWCDFPPSQGEGRGGGGVKDVMKFIKNSI
jgi:hypothetical protein